MISYFNIATLSVLILFFVSCKKPELSNFSDANFKHGAHGEIPLLPNHDIIAPGQFYPVSDAAGSLQLAVTKKLTYLTVGNNESADKSCKINEGVEVYVVAIIKTQKNIQLAITQINDSCVPKNADIADPNVEKLFEGYVPFEDLEFRNPKFAEKGVEDLTKSDIEGVKVEHIADTVSQTPAEILSGGDMEAIKDLIRQSMDDPTIQLGGGVKGCIAVEQGPKPINNDYIGCDPKNDGKIDGSKVTLSFNGILGCSIPGGDFRAAKTNKYLHIYGSATKWKVSAHKGAVPPGDVTHTTGEPMAAKTFDGMLPGVTFVPIDQIITPNEWRNTPTYFLVEGLDATGKSISPVCVHGSSIASPIALDLSLSQRGVRTIDEIGKKVQFDLNGDGSKEKSGWIYPYMGLLTYDWNGNGIVDSGKELFGEYSQNESIAKFEHGYQPLSYLDSDKNGLIDSRDPAFFGLKIWVDANMDGVSQTSELKSLTEHSITRLEVAFKAIAPIPGQYNQILYSSKYFGTGHCQKGCAAYDIFFGTEKTIIQANSKN